MRSLTKRPKRRRGTEELTGPRGEVQATTVCLLHDIKQRGQRIYGVGAPSRASTLITYTGLDDGVIDCVLEIGGSYKIGKYMPGTRSLSSRNRVCSMIRRTMRCCCPGTLQTN